LVVILTFLGANPERRVPEIAEIEGKSVGVVEVPSGFAPLDTVQKTSEKTVEKASEKTSEKTSEKILDLIRKNPHITIDELSGSMGKSG